MINQRSQRNYIIAFLCLVLVLMGVGYAAFSSVLRINGTASITNSWCLGFDNTKTNTYQATAGLAGGTTPTGTMSYTGTPCGTNIVSHSDLSANFYQPGDRITYTLTIKNKSSVTAAIKSIKVENQSVTSNTTITKGNIIYTVNMPLSTTLSSNAETTMTIVADFQDDTSIGTGYTGETQTLSVEINGQQDDGNGGFTPTFTGTIYRNNNTETKNGDVISDKIVYNITADGVYGHGPTGDYETLEECLDDMTNKYHITSGYECKKFEFEGLVYTTDASTLNKTYYLKHDVEDDIITASYVCFVYNNVEHCMKGAVNESSLESKPIFNTNTQVIKDYQSHYNLGEKSPGTTGVGCFFNGAQSACTNNQTEINAASDGTVDVYVNNFANSCFVNNASLSYCN